MARSVNTVGTRVKLIALTLLVVENSFVVLAMRTASAQDGHVFSNSSVVATTEALKLVASVLALLASKKSKFFQYVREEVVDEPGDMLKFCVPAVLYVMQQLFILVALSSLDAPVFQVSYQIKIFISAALSILLLQIQLTLHHWVSLIVLFCGVVLVNLRDAVKDERNEHHNIFLGLVCIIFASFSTSFAGVYLEKILKGSNHSLWLRNLQLSSYGTVLSVIVCWTQDKEEILKNGVFHGWTPLVWLAVIFQAAGGFLVAYIIRYTNNLAKGFATAVSTVVSCALSGPLFGWEPTIDFGIGAMLVVASTAMYSYIGPPKLKKI